MNLNYKIIFVNFFVFVVLLFFCEIFLRIYFNNNLNYNVEMWKYANTLKKPSDNTNLPFTHYPNKSGNFYNVEISTNSHGFRDYEYKIKNDKNKKRILILGDSFTLGWGVSLNDLFSKKLEKKLNKQNNNFEVINTGIGNYNSSMQVELFKEYGIKFNPDLVVLMFYINDVEKTPKVMPKIEYFLKSKFILYSFFFDTYLKIKTNFVKEFSWKSYYSNLYNDKNEGLRQNTNSLIELIEICNNKNIDLLFVNIPELRNLKNYEFNFANNFIKAIAEKNKVDFLDLLKVLDKYESSTLWVSQEDPHANAKANDIIGNVLFKTIYKRKSIK